MKVVPKRLLVNHGVLSWPVRCLNETLYVRPGDVVCIVGTPRSGKTSLAAASSLLWSRQHKVAFFYEDDPCITFKGFYNHPEDLITPNMDIAASDCFDVGNIAQLVQDNGYKIIVIDNYSLLHCSSRGPDREASIISELCSIANAFRVAVVVTHCLRHHESNFEDHPAFEFARAVIKVERFNPKVSPEVMATDILKNETSF